MTPKGSDSIAQGNEWVKIVRSHFTNDDLMREAEAVPRHTPDELAG